MRFRAWVTVLAVLLAVAGGALHAQESPAPAPKPKPKPNPLTPFFGDLESRFSIIAAGHRLLRDAYDIDRVVGDPRTLRPETQASLRHIPDRMKLNLARYLADHATDLYIESPPHAPEGHAEMTFTAREGLADQFQALAVRSFEGALHDDQLVDLGVFLLAKSPFFPKTAEGWEKLKNEIVTYDVYLALLVLAVQIARDEGSFGISGWLFKADGDHFRIGWYGNFSKLGKELKPVASAGLKARSEYLETSAGARGRVGDGEKLAAEARFVEHWFSKLAKPLGWEFQFSTGASYVFEHTDETKEKIGSASTGLFAKRENVFGRVNLTVGADAAVNTRGDKSGNVTALIEDKHGDWLGVVHLAHNSKGIDDNKDRRWKLGAFVGGKLGSRLDLMTAYLRTDIEQIEKDLSELERYRTDVDALAEALYQGKVVTENEQALAELWVGIARLHLRGHFSEYESDLAELNESRGRGDPLVRPLSPEQAAQVQAEAAGDTFGAEKHPVYLIEITR